MRIAGSQSAFAHAAAAVAPLAGIHHVLVDQFAVDDRQELSKSSRAPSRPSIVTRACPRRAMRRVLGPHLHQAFAVSRNCVFADFPQPPFCFFWCNALKMQQQIKSVVQQPERRL
ncbi:MAG: hypothetical protein ACT4QC_15195 [Planctomycetaceae bacterium]